MSLISLYLEPLLDSMQALTVIRTFFYKLPEAKDLSVTAIYFYVNLMFNELAKKRN